MVWMDLEGWISAKYLLRFIYTLFIVVVTLPDKTTGKVQCIG